jgi:ribosomal protein L37AE/L43A
MSKSKQSVKRNHCIECDDYVPVLRWRLGYHTCLKCGEVQARQVKHTVAPMPKSNYILITDHSLLRGLNTSHKGGVA